MGCGSWFVGLGGSSVCNVTNSITFRLFVLLVLKFAILGAIIPSRSNNVLIGFKGIGTTTKAFRPGCAKRRPPRRAAPPPPPIPRPGMRAPGRSLIARRVRRDITVRRTGGGGRGRRRHGGRRRGGQGRRTRGRHVHGRRTRGGHLTRRHHGGRRTVDGGITNTFKVNDRRKGDRKSTKSKANGRNDPFKGSSRKTGRNINKCNSFGLGKHSVKTKNLPHPTCAVRRRKQVMVGVAMSPGKGIVFTRVNGNAGVSGNSVHGDTLSTTGHTGFGDVDKTGGRDNAVACLCGLGWFVVCRRLVGRGLWVVVRGSWVVGGTVMFLTGNFRRVRTLKAISVLHHNKVRIAAISVAASPIIVNTRGIPIATSAALGGTLLGSTSTLVLPKNVPNTSGLGSSRAIGRTLLKRCHRNHVMTTVYTTPVMLNKLNLLGNHGTAYCPNFRPGLVNTGIANRTIRISSGIVANGNPKLIVGFNLTLITTVGGSTITRRITTKLLLWRGSRSALVRNILGTLVPVFNIEAKLF